MTWFGGVPILYWVAVALTLLALWADDVRGLYLAGACLVAGVGQQLRDLLTTKQPEE
jgi:hypothetical protein